MIKVSPSISIIGTPITVLRRCPPSAASKAYSGDCCSSYWQETTAKTKSPISSRISHADSENMPLLKSLLHLLEFCLFFIPWCSLITAGSEYGKISIYLILQTDRYVNHPGYLGDSFSWVRHPTSNLEIFPNSTQSHFKRHQYWRQSTLGTLHRHR